MPRRAARRRHSTTSRGTRVSQLAIPTTRSASSDRDGTTLDDEPAIRQTCKTDTDRTGPASSRTRRLLQGVPHALRPGHSDGLGELRQRVGSLARVDGRGLCRVKRSLEAAPRPRRSHARRPARPVVPRGPRRRRDRAFLDFGPLLRARLRERRARTSAASSGSPGSDRSQPKSRPTRTLSPPTRRLRSER